MTLAPDARLPHRLRYHLRRLLSPAIFAVGLVLAGCESLNSDSTTGTSTGTATSGIARPSLKDLKDEDWASLITDLDCSPMNRGVEILDTRFADVRGEGVEDAFVWVDCVHYASTWPHQLEIFDGSSDPARPRRLAVLVRADERLLVRSLSFSGHTVTVDAAGYAPQDPLCCPSLPVHRVFVWTGDQFRRDSG